jgi:hypothetical protein
VNSLKHPIEFLYRIRRKSVEIIDVFHSASARLRPRRTALRFARHTPLTNCFTQQRSSCRTRHKIFSTPPVFLDIQVRSIQYDGQQDTD